MALVVLQRLCASRHEDMKSNLQTKSQARHLKRPN